MAPWTCGIAGCGRRFDGAEALIRHQVGDHPAADCRVCGETLPAGFLAIRHTFEEHTRAEYVRAYDANSDEIRIREQLLELVEEAIDVPGLLSQLDTDDDGSAVSVGG